MATNDTWPTLADYITYEHDVVSALGLHPPTFLPADQVVARHQAYRNIYTDGGGASGGPASTSEARRSLLKVLSELNEVFQSYYEKMSQSLVKRATPKAMTTTSLNHVLEKTGLLSVLSTAELVLIQEKCTQWMQEHNIDFSTRPNALSSARSVCSDYHFPNSASAELEQYIASQTMLLLVKRGKLAAPTNTTSTPATTNNTNDDCEEGRVRIGDVLETITSEYPGIDWYDNDVINKIKMKTGSMMLSDERKRRFKRKRDDLGTRVYTEEDRPALERCIRSAVSAYVRRKQ